MLQKSLFILFIFLSGYLRAQIGINTDNPLQLFHIDGKGDNSSVSTALEILNDVVITSDGNMGIGTTTPSVKLEIQTGGTSTNIISGFQLQDGSQGLNKYLRSDANGVARWESANDNKMLWDSNHRFTIPTTGVYLIVLYITSLANNLPYANAWIGATMDSPVAGLNGVALFSYTRGNFLISNCNQVSDSGVYCSGSLFLKAGEVVGPGAMSFFGTGVPTLYIDMIPL